MATKRKAQQAFGISKEKNGSDGFGKPQLSAFAAARAATRTVDHLSEDSDSDREQLLASTIAEAPYDGHHSSRASPDAILDSDEEAVPEPSIPSQRLSKLSKITQNEADIMVFTLRPDESVTFIGEYDLEVLTGVVTIYGALLHPGRGVQRVYAPSVAPLPVVLPWKQDATVRVTSVKSGLQDMEDLSPLFRNIGTQDSDKGRSFSLLRTTSDDPLARTLAPLEIDERLKKIRLEPEGPPPRIMAVGPKSAGKSTFNRILCNMITSRPGKAKAKCLYLDLDPGQPEFGPPGQLALVEVTAPILGPAFTHHASTLSTAYRLIRSHTIAATSFKDDPEHYIACAVDLISRAPKDVPVVVNSCGWVSNLGASTILSLATKLAITETILLEPIDSELASELATITSSTPIRIPRRSRQQASRTPAELRAMQTMSYFHQKSSSSTKWIAKPISVIRPWIVSYSETSEPGISAILNYGQAPHPDFLAEVLDGSVLAIVVLDDAELIDSDTIQRTAAEDLPYVPTDRTGHTHPLDPRRSHCIDLALIRGISTSDKTLHLLTPLHESAIANVLVENQRVVLVRGGFDCPEWAYLEDLHLANREDFEERPWVRRRKGGQAYGIEGAVWRLRHPPLARHVR